MHKIQRAHINVYRFIYLCIHNLALVDSGVVNSSTNKQSTATTATTATTAR